MTTRFDRHAIRALWQQGFSIAEIAEYLRIPNAKSLKTYISIWRAEDGLEVWPMRAKHSPSAIAKPRPPPMSEFDKQRADYIKQDNKYQDAVREAIRKGLL